MTLATKFLSLSPERRGLVFEQAAAGLAGHAVILEKDFWVSWLLGLLFAQPELAPFLVFKGGTSLSKVFGVIDRFSEDIDLCLVPEFVGADASGFDALTSRVKRDAAVLEMQRLCADKVQQVLLPVLEGAIIDVLGTAPAGKWLHYELDVDAKSPILYFRYPTSQEHGIDYVRREVKLEMGTLTDQQPTGRYPIAPMVASVFVPHMIHPHQTVMRVITSTWSGCWRTPMHRSFWLTKRSVSALWTGKAACLPEAGRVTIWPAMVRSGWCRLRHGRLNWRAITRRCDLCS